MASLTETAKAVLEGKDLQEGYGINYPSVGNGGVSNPNPVDPSTASTGNAKTLKPGTKYKEEKARSQNGAGSADSSDLEGQQHDLGGNTPTKQGNLNLGAAAASDIGKDSSKAGQASVKAEPTKKLSEDEETEGSVVETSLAERVKALKEARKAKSEKEDDKDDDHEEKESKALKLVYQKKKSLLQLKKTLSLLQKNQKIQLSHIR